MDFPRRWAGRFWRGHRSVAVSLKEKTTFTGEKTMRSHKVEKIIVITLFLLVSLPCSSRAGIPSDQLRQTADKVLLILQQDGD
jgi:BarA-like signal transduction histidine kinase